jgi:hypothetical protein
MVDGLGPGGEQPVQLVQAGDRRRCGPGDLDQELVADSAEEPLDLPAALGLTGQSRLILWITAPG